MKLVQFIEDARKNVTLSVFEGRVTEAEAVHQLQGILSVVQVAQSDSKSDKLKKELENVEVALTATIQKLVG